MGQNGLSSLVIPSRTSCVLFTGEYLHTIDSKQRLAIPADHRSVMDPERDGNAFYAGPGPNGAIWLWSEKRFERLAEQIEQSLLPAVEILAFDELLFPSLRRLEMDASGRIRIPEPMLVESGLGNSVVVAGMRDHLELRDPEEWERTRPQRTARRQEINREARGAYTNFLFRNRNGGKEEGS